MPQNGINNEYEFIRFLNMRKISTLNTVFKMFLTELFGDLNDNDTIYCWKNYLPQKTDIFIKIANTTKRISLKMGTRNSVHVDPISKFVSFLKENGVQGKTIHEYLKYHYTDGTTNGRGSIRQSVKEYKKHHQLEIDRINQELNREEIVLSAVNRFVIYGDNCTEPIYALVHGTITSFVWISKEDLIHILLGKSKYFYSTGIHFSKLHCQPFARCLNKNPKYEKNRYCIQIKWFSMYDEIIENMYEKTRQTLKEKDITAE